ncbi:MAG: hypothetical protein EB087_07945, partial [Flavobacteriales bacterium]|nr:hypothetical protein [Flavobacteriales bacterium]
KVQSKNVNIIEKTSREVSELIDAGIELNSDAPEYYYTKLAALKLSMIEQATKDAYNRAIKIAENGGGSLGNMKNSIRKYKLCAQYPFYFPIGQNQKIAMNYLNF